MLSGAKLHRVHGGVLFCGAMEIDFLEMFDDCPGIDETGTGNLAVLERGLDDILDEVGPGSTDILPSINAGQSQLVTVQSEKKR